jgi:hypothetical protein
VKPAAPAKFLRVQRDDKGTPVALETSVVRYVPADGTAGVAVDLVAAVHIGDREYYDKLNELFDGYDVVLYELVAPPGTKIPKGGKREKENPLAMIQQFMKSLFGLESQTERVDYTKKHFVHADLSPEQMAEAIKNRGDDGLTIALGVAADLIRQGNLQARKAEDRPKKPAKDLPEMDLFSLILDPDGPRKLKQVMAEQFDEMEAQNGGLGPTISTILIADRNEAAMKVFQKELAKGQKKIAIFYGAAHMPDFEKRLKGDFGLKRDTEKWLTAWHLGANPKK